MHATDVKLNEANELADDGPSIIGRFTWAVVGTFCIPCLLKNDGTKYVCARIAEAKVLAHFIRKLNTEVFNCVSVKSFCITEAENRLLNEINSKHCDFAFGRDQFSIDSDFIVKLDDLKEFYNFMDICYTKLISQTAASDKNNKCGFVRINDDSVVPYAVKNDQKYVPLFYFEGETESLKTKAINLENWDLAYLKFCCKVQGIKNELFASEKCLVTSLDDVKSYFPEGTKFDDYWPSKIAEMQQSTPRNEMNGNHSWVQTPHVDSATATRSSVPTSPLTMMQKTMPSTLIKQLQNNQRLSNMSSTAPAYQQNWPSPMITNGTTNNVQSNSYQMMQSVGQSRVVQKQTTTMHPINSNMNATQRSYSNPNMRAQLPQFYSPPTLNVPSASGTTQPPPPLVRVTAANPIQNSYANSISDTYAANVYSNNIGVPTLYSVTAPSRHINNVTSIQGTNKVRSNLSSQVTNSNATRFPPALTPINGMNNMTATNGVIIQNSSSNMNNIMMANTRHVTAYNQSGEVIDLSSPPHSPQHSNGNVTRLNTASANGYNYHKSKSHSMNLDYVSDAQIKSNISSIPPYKLHTIQISNKFVQVINLRPYLEEEKVIPLQDVQTNFFPRADLNLLRNALQTVFNVNLYGASPLQLQLLREHRKGKPLGDEVPLITVKDFETYHQPLLYMEFKLRPDHDSIERDAKRQKIS